MLFYHRVLSILFVIYLWRTSLIPYLVGRGRWIVEFEASLVYSVSSGIARDYTEKHCL